MKLSSCAPLRSLSVVLAFVLGCGGSETPPAETPSAPGTAAPVPASGAKEKPTEGAKAGESTFDVDFVEAKESQPIDKPPRVNVDVPGFDQFLPATLVKATRVRYKVEFFDSAPSGSYLQFLLDGKPFRKVTDPTEKIMLTDLAGTEEIPEGEHILAAFINRPNHESIKSERGIAVRRFYTGKRIQGGWSSNKDPLLVVGSPHGTYPGDVLVDWYLLNAKLSKNEYSVRTLLKGPGIKPDGIQRVITEWKPWIILSAHDGGAYSVKMELLDSSGDPVPYGTAERSFTVKK